MSEFLDVAESLLHRLESARVRLELIAWNAALPPPGLRAVHRGHRPPAEEFVVPDDAFAVPEDLRHSAEVEVTLREGIPAASLDLPALDLPVEVFRAPPSEPDLEPATPVTAPVKVEPAPTISPTVALAGDSAEALEAELAAMIAAEVASSDGEEDDLLPSQPTIIRPQPPRTKKSERAVAAIAPPREAPPPAVAAPREAPPPTVSLPDAAPRPPSPTSSLDDMLAAQGADEAMAAGDEDESFGSGEGRKGGLRIGSRRAVSGRPAAPRLTDEADEGQPAEGSATADGVVMDLDLGMVEAVADVDESEVTTFIEQAQGAEKSGDLHAAVLSYSDALDLAPDFVPGILARGRCHLDLGDYAAAMSDFQRAEDLDPKSVDPIVEMGNVFFARKSYQRATEFYDRALDTDPDHAMALFRRGVCHHYKKNFAAALDDLDRAKGLDPSIPQINKYLTMVSKALGRVGKP